MGFATQLLLPLLGLLLQFIYGLSFVIFMYIGVMMVNLDVASFVILVFLFFPSW
jgi:hypothetical protein